MALEPKVKNGVKLASTELINKSMILLATPTISDDTAYRIYCLLDKLRHGYLDEKTFNSHDGRHHHSIYDMLETILKEDNGIDPNVRKIFLSLYESYEGYCTQLISDGSIDKKFNEGMENKDIRRHFNKRFSSFLIQFAFSEGTQLFPTASLPDVIATLEETKLALKSKEHIDINSLYVILTYLEKNAKESGLKQAIRDLGVSINNALQPAENAPQAAEDKSLRAGMKIFGGKNKHQLHDTPEKHINETPAPHKKR